MRSKIALFIFATLLVSGSLSFVVADQSAPKSIGLTNIPAKIKKMKQADKAIHELADAIDELYRMIHNDIDDINRDEIPALEASIAAIGTIDFDVPLTTDLNIRKSGASVIWDAGTIDFGGTTYSVSSGSHGPASQGGIYWTVGASVLTASDSPTIGLGSSRWYLAYYDVSANVSQTSASVILNGGLIQGSTITSLQILARTIEAGDIATDTITANEISAGTITGDELNVNITYTGSLVVGESGDNGTIEMVTAPGNGDTFIASTSKITGGVGEFDTTDTGFILGIDDSDGDLPKFFVGSSTEHFFFDGTNSYFNGTNGSLGSSTDFFNITDGGMQLYNAARSSYLYASGDELEITSGAGGTGTIYVQLYGGYLLLRARSGQGALLEVQNQSGQYLIQASADGTDNEFISIGESGTHRILWNEIGSNWEIGGFDFSTCVWTDDFDHDGSNIGFFGITPTTRQTELTDELTTLSGDITPSTPDYVMAATTAGWGCGSQDEFETMTSVIANLQARVNEMETKLSAYGLLQDAD